MAMLMNWARQQHCNICGRDVVFVTCLNDKDVPAGHYNAVQQQQPVDVSVYM